MKKERTGIRLVTGLLGASLLISPLTFAMEGAKEGSSAVEGQHTGGHHTKRHTGGKVRRAKGKRTMKKTVPKEGSGTM